MKKYIIAVKSHVNATRQKELIHDLMNWLERPDARNMTDFCILDPREMVILEHDAATAEFGDRPRASSDGFAKRPTKNQKNELPF